MRFFSLGLSVALLVAASPRVANAQSIQEQIFEGFPSGAPRVPSPPGKQEEEFLKSHAKMLTDNGSLLNFLRSRAAGWKYRNVAELVRQLGSVAYREREEAMQILVAMGDAALPELEKKSADRDIELSARAKSCISAIEKNGKEDFALPVVRLLIVRKPPEAFDTLLAFLPCSVDEDVEEEIYYFLDKSISAGAPMPASLINALDDAAPARRAVAACIIGRRGSDQQKRKVEKIAGTDPDAIVRLRAAQGLLAAHDKAALPHLIGLLRGTSVSVGWQAEELLRWAAAKTAPDALLGCATEKEQASCNAAWSAWWVRQKERFDFRRDGANPGTPCLFLAWGRQCPEKPSDTPVWTMGSDGSRRHVFPIRGWDPMDARWYPGNRLMVFSCDLAEFDLTGQIVRSFPSNFSLANRYRRLSCRRWEFARDGSGRSYDTVMASFEDLPRARLAQPFPEWRGLCSERRPRPDGCKIVTEPLSSLQPYGRAIRFESEGQAQCEVFWPSEISISLLHSLIRFGFTSEPRPDVLENRLRLLSSDQYLIRRYASEHLVRIPMTASVFARAMSALNDGDDIVRANLLAWIGKSGEFSRKALPHLNGILDHSGVDMARGYWSVLDAVPPEEAIAALTSVFNDKSGKRTNEGRANAIEFLGKLYLIHEPKVADILRVALKDPDAVVRSGALSALYYRRNDPVRAKFLVDEVVQAVFDQDAQVSNLAASCVATMNPDAPAIKKLMSAAQEKANREKIVSAFAMIGRKDRGVTNFLVGVLMDDQDPRMVAAAAKAIGIRNDRDDETIITLATTLVKWQDKGEGEVTQAVVTALQQVPSTATRVLSKCALDGEGISPRWEASVIALGHIDRIAQKDLKRVLRTRFGGQKMFPRLLLDD